MTVVSEEISLVSGVAVVVVDVQFDFLDSAKSPLAGAGQKAFCIPGIRKLLAYAKAAGWPVVHVKTVHQGRQTLPKHLDRSHTQVFCLDGEPGTDFVIPPAKCDQVVSKKFYSSFRETDLELRLRGVGAERVLFCGVATDCCILQSAFDADYFGFQAFVPLQAVSASTANGFSAGLASIAKSAAEIVDLEDLLKGVEFSKAAIPVKSVGERASSWFEKQEAKIGHLAGPRSLDALLDALS